MPLWFEGDVIPQQLIDILAVNLAPDNAGTENDDIDFSQSENENRDNDDDGEYDG